MQLGGMSHEKETQMKTGLQTLRRAAAFSLMLTTTLLIAEPQQAWSMLAPAKTETVTRDREADLETIRVALESKILRQRLQDYGYTPAQVEQKLSKLSDQEVHQLASRIETLNP